MIHKVEHLEQQREQTGYLLFEGKNGLVGILSGLLQLDRSRKWGFRERVRLVGYCVLHRIGLR